MTRLSFLRGSLPVFVLLAWAGCFNSLDFENILCHPDKPSSCPKDSVCTAQGGQFVCHKKGAPQDGEALSDAHGDGAPDMARDGSRPDLDWEMDVRTGTSSDGQDALDGTALDRPIEPLRDTGLDSPISGTGGVAADGPSGMGGIVSTGGVLGTGGGSGAGGSSVDAPLTGGIVGSGGISGTGGLTVVPGTGGLTGSGGVGTGGSSGTGGLWGSGGVGTGGVIGTGGLWGTGGVVGTGGVIGTGGLLGTGGAGTGGTVSPPDVTVQLDKTFQTIQGFGISTALSSTTIPVSTLFDTTGADGIGLSILRIGMTPEGILAGTGVSEAKAKGAKIIGTCWSAPASCKSNNSTRDGGHLLEACYTSWSTTIANFAKQQGLYAMSIGNAPDFASCPGNPVCTDSYETMTYTAKQMVAWAKVAGMKIKEVSPTTKVIAPEASEWNHVWSNLSATGSLVSSHPDSSDPLHCACFSNSITAEKEATCAQTCLDGNGYDYGHWLWRDQNAWQAFDILGLQEYDSQTAFAWPADVNGGRRDKEVWQTEMSGIMHWPEQGPSDDINNGLAVAGWIHSALTVGEASAWLYWWYKSLYQDDNEGLALTKNGTTIAKRYYAMGNYSKFVRPDYVRVGLADASQDVLLSAYKSSDGKTVVVVAVNRGSGAASPRIGFAGGTVPASCSPTVTSSSDSLKDGTAVTLTAGVLTASLASKSVTTYVCK